jgi:RNA polymerase sigma-70 factor (ECF subfamily)
MFFSEELFKQKTGEDFSSFYEEYNPKLIYFINSICKNNQMAQDIATDSYMDAFDNILSYNKEKAKFSTWLFTIARNNTINEIKVLKKTLHEETFDIIEEKEEVDPFIDEKASIVIEQINNLNEPYRDVMKMILLDRKSYKDISIKYNKNINTIKSWIRKGRSLIKDLSEKEFNKLKNKDKIW